jgi:2,4-dienoyl-CoA reductase-like NADH-dependent reductase (Old Yellow Enzyme family)
MSLFEPYTIKSLEIRNRFVRSATYDGIADKNSRVSERQMKLYEELAHGKVGLIVTGIAYVDVTGRISPWQNSIAHDDDIAGFSRLTRMVHDLGGKIAVQLFHAGRETSKIYQKRPALAPSFVPDDPLFTAPHREMEEAEIAQIIDAFGKGAARARAAGFDAVQLHGAHAYLLSQFLSPFTNRRKDRWGGSLQNRLRLHRDIIRVVRSGVGADFPVLMKLGVEDGFTGGLEFREGLAAAEILANDGLDAIEISSGLRGRGYKHSEFRTGINRPSREGYFRDWCREIKQRVDIPVIMVGGIRSLDTAAKVIQDGTADLVSLSRPLIREPDLIARWQSGDLQPATCVSCNLCMEALLAAKPFGCYYKAKNLISDARSELRIRNIRNRQRTRRKG